MEERKDERDRRDDPKYGLEVVYLMAKIVAVGLVIAALYQHVSGDSYKYVEWEDQGSFIRFNSETGEAHVLSRKSAPSGVQWQKLAAPPDR